MEGYNKKIDIESKCPLLVEVGSYTFLYKNKLYKNNEAEIR